jgi:hypothetical protein
VDKVIWAPRTPWPPNFPAVIGQTSYQAMRNHAFYPAAKAGISNEAAISLVFDCVSEAGTDRLREILGPTSPIVVAVHAEESAGRNKIPIAYAEVLADALGLVTEPGIVQSSVANHSGARSIYHRMVSQPTFAGPVQLGSAYLLVDDTCAAGGTLANLKGYIEQAGGSVVAMSVLALARHDHPYWISLAGSTLARLCYKHPDLDSVWKREFGCGIDTLTEGEAGHLLKAPSVDLIRNRLADARRDLDIERDEGDPQGP